MKRYSLANHVLSIKPNDNQINNIFGTISIGGEGNYLESVSVSNENTLWSTTGYATGAWVHNKNLAKTGTVTISLNQLSDQVAKLITLCETYYGGDYEGFTLTLTKNDNTKICTCIDCYISKIPTQSFGTSAANQSWVFTCGKITFN